VSFEPIGPGRLKGVSGAGAGSVLMDDEELVLTLAAPEEARLIVDDLVRSFRGGD
jgi:hypothetical protein